MLARSQGGPTHEYVCDERRFLASALCSPTECGAGDRLQRFLCGAPYRALLGLVTTKPAARKKTDGRLVPEWAGTPGSPAEMGRKLEGRKRKPAVKDILPSNFLPIRLAWLPARFPGGGFYERSWWKNVSLERLTYGGDTKKASNLAVAGLAEYTPQDSNL